MSYHRHNVSVATGNFTGATTGSATTSLVAGNSVFIGKDEKKVIDLAAHVVATITMTGATLKLKWQGSNDASTWIDLANDSANQAAVAFATGVASGTTLGFPAPAAAYAYKYARPVSVWTSTTAGTTNDAISIGLNYRQIEAGGGL